MSMIKVIAAGSNPFDEPRVQEIRFKRNGYLDLQEKLAFEKRASVDFLRELDRLREKIANDETLIHMLAIGATEDYGANRNGDGFRRCTCKNYHPTFVKHAHFYRNHQNKDPRKSYGRLVKSAWNEPMKRIELLVALNSNESAAHRNKGLVADKEMEKLASGKEIPVSMACKVAYDVCSYCGNQAPTIKEYCTGLREGGHCKAGGLKNHLGSLVEIDGGIHQLHADNPHPTFFDISHVFRPADRIAYVMGTLEKQASTFGNIVKSSELARQMGVSVPYELMVDGSHPRQVQELVKLAYQLAEMEQNIEAGECLQPACYQTIFSPELQTPGELPHAQMVREKFALALRALTDRHICLPVNRFIEIVADQPFEKAAEVAVVVSRELPGIYTRLIEDDKLPEKIKTSQYAPAEVVAPPALSQWAEKLAAELSLESRHVDTRVVRAAFRLIEANGLRTTPSHEKTASDNDPVKRLAEEYALYKLAFLGALNHNGTNLPLTADLALLQNYVV